jgi:lipopolysaccharide/colanic/teichoic acid biosynthesis glycosyltransferase
MGVSVRRLLSWSWRAKGRYALAPPPKGVINPKRFDPSSEIIAASLFRGMLYLERKRAERSRKGFLLMLIDAKSISEPDSRAQVLRKCFAALSDAIRVTDLCGWYEGETVLGVLLTDIGANRSSIMTSMRTKLLTVLQDNSDSKDVSKLRISFHLFPEDWEKKDPRCPIDLIPYPDLSEEKNSRSVYRIAKRAMDIVISVAVLVVSSPLFIIISLAIKLSSKGPVLFKQQRVGQLGVVFTCLKFRTMRIASDHSVHREYMEQFISGGVTTEESRCVKKPFYKIQQDQRVTRVGTILRKSSLDELPQFLNVLRGEMSVVGPRPPIPYEVERYDIWHRRRVSEVKPGITGLWQVKGRSRLKFDDSVRLDLKYIETRTVWLDIKILLQTPLAVLAGDGAS